MWKGMIIKTKKGGIDVIESYVFWSIHEPSPGSYNFEGRYDLVRFVKTIQRAGLYAHLRIGPYVCAERNFGGFPVWLKYVPGISFRTDNEPFKIEKESPDLQICPKNHEILELERQESNFQFRWDLEWSRLQVEVEELDKILHSATDDDEFGDAVDSSIQDCDEKLGLSKKELAAKLRSVVQLKRELDEVPTQDELIQYTFKRFESLPHE